MEILAMSTLLLCTALYPVNLTSCATVILVQYTKAHMFQRLLFFYLHRQHFKDVGGAR